MPNDVDNELLELRIQKKRPVTYSISGNLHLKLKQHLLFLKVLNKPYSLNSWVTEAIRELIEKDPSEIGREEHLVLRLDVSLENEMANIVKAVADKRTGSYSRKQLILEAVYNKLDKEHGDIKNQIQKLIPQKHLSSSKKKHKK